MSVQTSTEENATVYGCTCHNVRWVHSIQPAGSGIWRAIGAEFELIVRPFEDEPYGTIDEVRAHHTLVVMPGPAIRAHRAVREPLTEAEHRAMDLTASLVTALHAVVDSGPTRDADLRELLDPIHQIQNAILAQAAARAYPDRYRVLGGVLSRRVADHAPH